MTSPRTSPVLLLLGVVFLFASNVLASAAVLGIDFGTQTIKAVLVKPGVPFDIVLTKDSRRKELAAVAFKQLRGVRKEGQFPERTYGADAMAIAARFPDEVYPNLKTLLGLRMWDKEVNKFKTQHPGLNIAGSPNRATVAFKSSSLPEGDDAPWGLEELLAMQLASIRQNAQLAAGEDSRVRSAVLTIPSYFTAAETRAIRTAAELAGLKVTSVISDGLAVGLNYATTRQFPNVDEGAKAEHHLVLDMGAGSTTATVMRFQSRNVKDVGKFNKTVQEIQVLGTGWDRNLGGNELNYIIIEQMILDFTVSEPATAKEITVEQVMSHPRTMAKLKREAERARHVLSANQEVVIQFEELYDDIDFKYTLTRPDFTEMAEIHVEKLLELFHDALRMAGLDVEDLTSVILHGGATRTPFIQKTLEEHVGSADKIRTNVNSDEAAAFGAAFKAAELSPSFRVKEIRTSEAASYAAGLAWMDKTDGQLKHHEFWPAGFSHGVVSETTLSDLEDFSGSFYQKIGPLSRDVKKFSTKNLTATAAALKEKYPSCVDPQFRIGLKLRSEDGEMEIAKAVVECEAEVSEKETLMDGVKNLFGLGKKDQKPLKPEDGGSATSEGESSVEQPKGESATASSADAEATEEVAKEVKKKKAIVSIPVEISTENAGFPDLTKDEWTKARNRLKAFAASDKQRLEREEAINQLESFSYRVRDMVELESFIAKSTEEERDTLSKKALEFGEWLYEDGEEADVQEFKDKLKILQALSEPIVTRIKEARERPELVERLKEALGRAGKLLAISRHRSKTYEDWVASSGGKEGAAAEERGSGFEGLEDEDNKDKEEAEKQAGPLKPAHTPKELDDFQSVVINTEGWLVTQENAQNDLPETADPVLLTHDVFLRYQELLSKNLEFSRKLLPKQKPKSKSKGATENTYADLEDIIYKDDPFTKENGEPMSDQEVQELLRRAKEWAALRGNSEQPKGQYAEESTEPASAESETARHEHDEL